MTPRVFLSALLALATLAVGAPFAGADEIRPPTLKPDAIELLPHGTFERQDFYKEHGSLVYRMNAVRKRLGQLRSQRAKLYAKRGKRSAADTKRIGELNAQIGRTAPQVSALMGRITGELREDGIDGALIAYMNHAPTGARRVQRYGQGLVLLLEDLTPAQRWMFDRTITQMEGAYQANAAQRERTMLAIKQTELDKDKQREIARTFDRQLQVMEKRFWLLVDVTLDRDQKVWIWNHLPLSLRRKSQAVEHLYTLPGLTPSQGTRLRSLVTEIEHESSPDNAAVRRIRAELQTKGRKLAPEERKALEKERGEAYGRLNELNRIRRDGVREILSEEQWRAYVAIPPGLSTNERSGSYRRTLEGWKPSGAQQAKIAALQKAQRAAARKAQQRMALARRGSAELSADAPQMMEMQMAMEGARAEQAQASRDLLGAIFTDVMSADEAARFVLGHWGYKR